MPHPPPTEARRRAALSLVLALPVLVTTGWCWLLEHPRAPVGDDPGRARRAAVALRDHVSPFEEWGTRMFTLPTLQRAYGHVAYFTADDRDSRREAVTRALAEALETHEAVDFFILAHGNGTWRWLEAIPEAHRGRLRLVYNTGCGDAWQAARWQELGADTYVGHPGASASPIFYFYFLRRWVRDTPVAEAREAGNARMDRVLSGISPILARFIDPQEVRDGSRALLFGAQDTRLRSPTPQEAP